VFGASEEGWIEFTHLDSCPNDLVWVSYGQREDFASPGSNYIRGVRLHRKQRNRVGSDHKRIRIRLAKYAETHQLIIFQSVRPPSLLERCSFPFEREPFDPFVRHELQGTITDADQCQESPSVETSHSLRPVDARQSIYATSRASVSMAASAPLRQR
jgi:hypothetical protein